MMRQQPKTHRIDVGDITLAYHEWKTSEPDAHTLVIVHATGFHGRCYDPIAHAFPECRVIAVDLHGHGQSTGEPITEWQVLVDELGGLIEELDLSSATGIGHSMGAHAILRAAAAHPSAFARLVLFDPVVLPPEYYEAGKTLHKQGEMHPAARRKRDFASAEEMIERFQSRDPYQLFRRDVFEGYCRHGLTPVEGGGFELACAPEVEAAFYMSSLSGASAIEVAKTLQTPTTVVRAKQSEVRDFKGSPTWPGLADSMPNAIDMHRPDRTHFHPFEDPDDAARIIREAIES